MGHIREPKGVDFFIKSDPLTQQVREEISEFIREYKNKSASKTIQKKHKFERSNRFLLNNNTCTPILFVFIRKYSF